MSGWRSENGWAMRTERVVDRRLAVGVPLAHHVAGDAGALHAGPVGTDAEVVHAPEDPAVRPA